MTFRERLRDLSNYGFVAMLITAVVIGVPLGIALSILLFGVPHAIDIHQPPPD